MKKELSVYHIAPIIAAIIILYFIGVVLTVLGNPGWSGFFATTIFLFTLFVFPGVIVYLGRVVLINATPSSIPIYLFPLLFMFSFLPTSYVLIPYAFEGFKIEFATELIFLVFEVSVLLSGFGFFAYYLRKYLKSNLTDKDLSLMLHYFVGGLIYFYFIRLTLLSSLLLQSAFELL